MKLTNVRSYSSLCDNPEFDPARIKDAMLEQVKQTMASWDTTTPNSLDAVDFHKDFLLDFCTTNGMRGGIGVFIKTIDKIGGTLQILHNSCPHIPRGAHHENKFACLMMSKAMTLMWFLSAKNC